MNLKHLFYTLLLSILLTGCSLWIDKKMVDIDSKESNPYQYYSTKVVNEDTNSKAHDYIELAKYGSAEQVNQTINETWKFLTGLSSTEQQSILIYSDETTLQGWIDLLYAYQNNYKGYTKSESDTDEIVAQKEQMLKKQFSDTLNDWSLQYPDHPAKILLADLINSYHPLNMDLQQTLNSGKKIALFLPLSGNLHIFGETIRQGYLDANRFYPQEPAQAVIMIDTTSAPMSTLIDQAKEQGAEMIVGPLLKEQVVEIKNLAPDLPVLALNRIENSGNSENGNGNGDETHKICFFTLSPEDEAKDAATHIFAEKHHKPLLLVPQTNLGRRVADSFAKQWQQLSHSPAYMQTFADVKTLSSQMNHGKGIKLVGDLITVDDDKRDEADLEGNTVNNSTVPESNSTNNDNFDAIYVYASYDELTFIKAMIEMESNWSLSSPSAPMMYISSKSNSANASTDFYYDMERVQFAEIPMIVNQNTLFTNDLENIVPVNIKNDYSLMRLYAMGVDAWYLANHFSQLSTESHNLITGMTGSLTTQSECEIARSLTWQQFHHGKAELVKVDLENSTNQETSSN